LTTGGGGGPPPDYSFTLTASGTSNMASFYVTPEQAECKEGQRVVFSAFYVDAETQQKQPAESEWSVNNEPHSAGKQSTLELPAGTYTVKASHVGSGLTDTASLVVAAQPVANITYTEVEYMKGGTTIKFGDASPCLGEDAADQTDTFTIKVANGSDNVTVKTKASTSSATVTLNGAGSSKTTAIGFRVALVSIAGNTYTFTVRSVNNPHALSHIEFGFGSGTSIISPSAGLSYTTTRTTQ